MNTCVITRGHRPVGHVYNQGMETLQVTMDIMRVDFKCKTSQVREE